MKTDHLRKSLEEEKARLESEMGSVGRKNPNVPGDWEAVPSETGQEPDEADQADVFVSGDTNAAILADLEARYDTVVGALARMDKDEYGVCEVCGKKIEQERLEADPAATTCKEHK
ncbi:MAG TPA: TraR/DksA C4-type zinc finger protein [Candidatus Paceibacterota bacterium]|nr:TraR/DksA C4-type zinc finger protein [Candidatus Paceibacterota bacterium]